MKFDRQTGRYGVKVAGCDKPKAVQNKNLEAIEHAVPIDGASSSQVTSDNSLEIGDFVTIHGLTSGAASWLNGCNGLEIQKCT